ncbi:terpene synthase family protein [Streptomyces albus]
MLTALYCPIPARCAPDPESIDRESIAWMTRLKMYGTARQRVALENLRVGHFACLTIPDGAQEEEERRTRRRHQLWSDTLMLLVAVDDALFDEPDMREAEETALVCLHMDRILENPTDDIEEGDLWWPVTAVRELMLRAAELATPAQLERWISSLRSTVLGGLLRNQLLCAPLTLNDYVAVRLTEGAVQNFMATVPIVGGYELPPGARLDGRVCALGDMANFLAMWDNDLFGHARETFHSQRYGHPVLPNAVNILSRERDVNPQEAMRLAIAVRDQVMKLFLQLSDEVLLDADPVLARYVHALGCFVPGYLEWALKITDRYARTFDLTETDEVAEFPLPSVCSEPPEEISEEELDLPVIARWREQLACDNRSANGCP